MAFSRIPVCYNNKDKVLTENHQAINLRDFMENGFKTRALLEGTLIRVLANSQGHTHLEVDLDNDFQTSDDRIEVIYNNEYGELPEVKNGDHLIACGDFILDTYSPFKAIIHWLHKSPNIRKHNDGFLAINNIVFGL
jgi:hypothetical protein